MATRMTINGVSTCTEAGTEKYERFQSGIGRRRRTLVQYDYPPYGRRTVRLCQTHIGRVPNRKEQVAERKAGKGGQPMNTTYQTLIVKFSEPIAALDGIFDDAQAWGTDTLKGWIDDYESTRFTATDSHTAVITSEYNMEWLQRQTPIAEMREF